MSQTAFNISGFIQPAFVEKMLPSDDADEFNDRQLFAFRPQRIVFLRDLVLPIPSGCLHLKAYTGKSGMSTRSLYNTS